MEKRKIAVVCGVVGALAGIAVGVTKIINKQRQGKYPYDKPERVWEA